MTVRLKLKEGLPHVCYTIKMFDIIFFFSQKNVRGITRDIDVDKSDYDGDVTTYDPVGLILSPKIFRSWTWCGS